MRVIRPALLLALALVMLVADRAAPLAGPLRPFWQPVPLPAPDGPPGRLLVRDVVTCEGRWFAVGGVMTADGGTRPAAWGSPDGRTWSSLEVRGDSYYGRRNVLGDAACRGGRLAALGAKSGGAHGNPRISAWWQPAPDRLAEATGSLSGGAVDAGVAGLAGGPGGWLVIGDGATGPTGWFSRDAARFASTDPPAGPGDGAAGRTRAYDVVATPSGWLAVGGRTPVGRIDPEPVAWASADGRAWTPQRVPTPDGYGELQRVAFVGGTAVAVGRRGARFGAWWTDGGGWRVGGGFGSADSSLSSVRALAAVDRHLIVAIDAGTHTGLWLSGDRGRSWRRMRPPVPVPVGGGTGIGLAADAGRLVLALDDGRGARLWRTETSVHGW